MMGLLQPVLDDHTHIEARLVYADWLQQQQDPRGEFITLHIQGHPQADELLKQHQRACTAFLLPAVKRGYLFVNGFVERITLKAEQHLDLLPGLFDHTPLHQVRLRDLKSHTARLAAPRLRESARFRRCWRRARGGSR